MESYEEIFGKKILALKERLAATEQLYLDQVNREQKDPELWRVQIGDLTKRLEATEARFHEEMNALELSVTSLNASIEESIDRREKFVTGVFFQEKVRPLEKSIALLHESLRAAEDKLRRLKA